jgi:hypothetical protein
MPIRHLYSLLCDYASEDRSGKRHFMGVFTSIELNQAPGPAPRFNAVVSFLGQPGEVFEIKIVNKLRTWDSFLLRGTIPPFHQEDLAESGFIIAGELANLEFPAVGGYELLLIEDPENAKREVHALPFGVRLTEESHVSPE